MVNGHSEQARPSDEQRTSDVVDADGSHPSDRWRVRSAAALQAALEGAELVAGWDAEEGGWLSRLRDPGARLAAAGFELAVQALDPGCSSTALTPEDLAMDAAGQFNGERVGRLAETLVAAELNLASDLLESMALAFEVAFESGIRRALSQAGH